MESAPSKSTLENAVAVARAARQSQGTSPAGSMTARPAPITPRLTNAPRISRTASITPSSCTDRVNGIPECGLPAPPPAADAAPQLPSDDLPPQCPPAEHEDPPTATNLENPALAIVHVVVDQPQLPSLPPQDCAAEEESVCATVVVKAADTDETVCATDSGELKAADQEPLGQRNSFASQFEVTSSSAPSTARARAPAPAPAPARSAPLSPLKPRDPYSLTKPKVQPREPIVPRHQSLSLFARADRVRNTAAPKDELLLEEPKLCAAAVDPMDGASLAEQRAVAAGGQRIVSAQQVGGLERTFEGSAERTVLLLHALKAAAGVMGRQPDDQAAKPSNVLSAQPSLKKGYGGDRWLSTNLSTDRTRLSKVDPDWREKPKHKVLLEAKRAANVVHVSVGAKRPKK